MRRFILLGLLTAGSFAATYLAATYWHKAAVENPPGMVWIRGGEFTMGTDSDIGWPDEKPAHRVRVDGFWIDETEVTNAQFRSFVVATRYVTTAEKPVEAEAILRQMPPGTPAPPPEKLVPGSLVFTPTAGPVKLDDYLRWRKWTPGANWRRAGVFLSVIQLSSFLTA